MKMTSDNRTDFTLTNAPSAPGWYGTVSGDGEGEVWVGTAYWDGKTWGKNMGRVYALSAHPFVTKEEAWDWAHSQPD